MTTHFAVQFVLILCGIVLIAVVEQMLAIAFKLNITVW